MRIFYLSTTSFADCELALLNRIGSSNTVKYGVIIPRKNNNYSEAELRSCLDSKAVDFLPIHLTYRYRDLRLIFTYIKLLQEIRRFKPDVIYINFFIGIPFNLMMMLFLRRSKTILGIHDVLQHSGTKYGSVLGMLQSMLLMKFTNVLTFSKSQGELLQKLYPKNRAFTIPLMLKDFGERKAATPDYSTVNFLFFGNIHPYKGLDVLLKAVEKLQARHSNFTLTIAGRCKDWETTYLPLIKNGANIDTHIRFIANEEIPVFYSKAHYLILPYKDVTQSGPLMIAYNYNLPVISSNIDGFKEFIEEGRTGFLFDALDVTGLESVLEEAVVRTGNEYRQLVANVEAYKEKNFSDSKTAGLYLSMFHAVTDPVGRKRPVLSRNEQLSGSIG